MNRKVQRQILILLVAAAFLLVWSYYDGRCHAVEHAGALITMDGVYCWRRLNEGYDTFRRLSELEKIRDMPDCDGLWCDPRYIPKPKDGSDL